MTQNETSAGRATAVAFATPSQGALRAFAVLIGVILFVWIVPLAPRLPFSAALDPSWASALNQATASGLVFGRDIVFTFGPFASVFTQEYHPGTDALMMGGSVLLASGFSALLLLTVAAGRRWIALALVIVLAGFISSGDVPLLFYPLVLAACIAERALASAEISAGPHARHQLSAVLGIGFAALGLLPLVKVSSLAIVGFTMAASALALMHAGRLRLAGLVLVAPIASCIALWVSAGQPLFALAGYFRSAVEITGGYSDAMSLVRNPLEVAAYLLGAASLSLGLLMAPNGTLAQRLYLSTVLAATCFIAFKAGFVRHDAHALIASGLMISATLLLLSLHARPAAKFLVLPFAAFLFITAQHRSLNPVMAVREVVQLHVSAYEGAVTRLTGEAAIASAFDAARKRVASGCALPEVAGTVDIYSYRQGCVVAAGKSWSPRPVFQSYSAYSPALAALNAAHLVGPAAPRSILFRVETIDGRLPSLDDGASWPNLLQHYRPSQLAGDFALLTRIDAPPRARAAPHGTRRQESINTWITIGEAEGALFARLQLEPSVLGSIVRLAYKAPQPAIEVDLMSGERKTFRFVPGMGQAGFLLSPLVVDTEGFKRLANGQGASLPAVRAFRLLISDADARFWQPTFDLTLQRLDE